MTNKLKHYTANIICDGTGSGKHTTSFPIFGELKSISLYGGSNNFAPTTNYALQITSEPEFTGSPVFTGNGSHVVFLDTTVASGTLPTTYYPLVTGHNAADGTELTGSIHERAVLHGKQTFNVWNCGSIANGKRVGILITYI
ncbi:MAG: hypothetical protein ACE5ES_05735 [Candidatus Nanoarchaeia archaeon]